MMMKVNMTGSSAVTGSVLCLPGAVRWHALLVAPQTEDQTEAWLQRRNVYAFHPVTTRKVTRAGKAREYHRRYLPGYVFARFPGEAIVGDVVSCPFIRGALLRSSGSWGVLNPSELRSLHSMRKLDQEAKVASRLEERRLRRSRNFRKGDRALFKSGAFVEQSCEVVEVLADGAIRLRLQLFGADVLTSANPEDLVALDRGC